MITEEEIEHVVGNGATALGEDLAALVKEDGGYRCSVKASIGSSV